MSAIRNLLQADPGLPSPNGTSPYWLDPLHPLAKVQSSSLPTNADVVIIGSGISALSVAKTLLEGNSKVSVAVLEARTICSGATGRNGGHLINPFPLSYASLKQTIGKEAALATLAFSTQNVTQVAELAKTCAPQESEIRLITRLRTYTDPALFEAEKRSIVEYETDFPEARGQFTFIDAQTCLTEHGIHGVLGAAKFDGFAVWPYRLIMKVWEEVYNREKGRLTLEALTPALQVIRNNDQSMPYTVRTPRGVINARQVVHCTNAWSSHLVPGLRARVFPYLESMTVQALDGVPNKGDRHSWSFHEQPRYIPEAKGASNGWCYLQQNAKTGEFFFGGVAGTAGTVLTADDSNTARTTADFLRGKLNSHFGIDEAKNRLVSSWTGSIARTTDHFPVVGRLTQEVTTRQGNDEWIAAGFNGGGMCMCWMAGLALGKMMAGEDVSDWFPKHFEFNLDRYDHSLLPTVDIPEFSMPSARL